MRPCFCDFLGGVLLLENPKGDNKLNLVKLKSVVTSIFGVKNAELSVFHGETGMWRARGYLVAGARGVAKVFLWCQLCGWAIVFSSLWGSRGSSAVSAAMSLLCPSLWYGWNHGHTESQGPHPPLLAMRQIRTHSPCWVVSLSDSSWALLNPDLESGDGSWSKALCNELGSSPRDPSKKMLQQDPGFSA